MKHTTFTWTEIKREVGRNHGSPISKLIDFVVDTELSNYLYPATMHTNLRIGRSKNFSRTDGELTIEYQDIGNEVVFNYYDSESGEPWTKECKANEIISTFMHIISKKLHWIKSEF